MLALIISRAAARQIREKLKFHNSAPHHYWGLFFFHTNKLRERCQLGHAGVNGFDFTLGRFDRGEPSSQVCRFQGWRSYWRPPQLHGVPSKSEGAAQCNASAIPGYLTMCPGTPSHLLRRTCDDVVENGTKAAHRHRDRASNGLSHIHNAPNTIERSKVPKPARDRLLELVGLRDEKLISPAEYESLRNKVLDTLVVHPVHSKQSQNREALR